MKLSQITKTFEERIPLSLQESWDQCGLNLGSRAQDIKKILFAYDVCLEVIAHAVKTKCQLIVSHHPFRLKAPVALDLDSYEGRLIAACVKNNIALYCAHTNHDSSADSLNFHYLKKLGLTDIAPLATQAQKLFKIVVYVPIEHTQIVLNALFAAGAGGIGEYSECSFRVQGTGSFKGGKNTNPAYGKKGRREEVTEDRVEVLVEEQKLDAAVEAMKAAHPYEEVAYDVFLLHLQRNQIGLGAHGVSPKGFGKAELVRKLKSLFKTKSIRFTNSGKKTFHRIGICTGSGTSLLPKAFAKNLDAFITGDVKYHQAIEAKRHDLALADVGHFFSEKDSVAVLRDIFRELFGDKLQYEIYEGLKDPFEIL